MKDFRTTQLIVILGLIFSYGQITNSSVLYKEELIIQSTTSTRDSGFYDYILPIFEKNYQINTKVVAYGTGQAIINAKNCNADILIVHSLNDEINFIQEGYGIERFDLMYNDFVIIGPSKDPLGISKEKKLKDVFLRILHGNSKFISRGDDSGTHKAEANIWNTLNANPISKNITSYFESGQGMGATINIAIGMNAYTFTDRATWINFKNKLDHKILFEGDPLLFNQYGVIRVNEKVCPNVNIESSKKFITWILSDVGKTLIQKYKVNNKQLFFIE